jgi:hypothetical protein
MKLNKSGESIGHIGADKDDYKYREKLKTDFGPRSDTGWDVVDKENYYNESGFADSKMENYYFQEIVDENELEPEMQELMDKYGFEEEWELNDWAKKCDAYLNGNVKVSPLKNETEVAELAGSVLILVLIIFHLVYSKEQSIKRNFSGPVLLILFSVFLSMFIESFFKKKSAKLKNTEFIY